MKPLFILALVLALSGCALTPRVETPAADSDAPSHEAPMPRLTGDDAATRKTSELLAAVGANELDALKPMDHAAMGHGGGAQKPGMDHSQHGQPAVKPSGGHEGMDHSQMPGTKPATPASDAAATAAEMKKTEDEMKRAADELKAKSDAMKAKPGAQPKATLHVCPMHPEVKSDKPGTCPKCGMALKPAAAKPGTDPHAHH
jgi:hypothetical protein